MNTKRYKYTEIRDREREETYIDTMPYRNKGSYKVREEKEKERRHKIAHLSSG